MCKKTASLFIWHNEEHIKDGALRYPADSIAWKDFHSRHDHFLKEFRNVRLGLASDGFNPFGTLNSQYSCWHIVLIPYNLPPWLCTKESYLFLSILIPGPNGYVMYDASLDETFTLHVTIMWIINDFSGYGYLSRYSVQGQFAVQITILRHAHCG